MMTRDFSSRPTSTAMSKPTCAISRRRRQKASMRSGDIATTTRAPRITRNCATTFWGTPSRRLAITVPIPIRPCKRSRKRSIGMTSLSGSLTRSDHEGVVAPSPSGLDLDDIQGMALRAYQFPFGRHIVLRASDQTVARLWLGRIAGQITTVAALDSRPDHAINVALSWRGLEALGLPDNSLQSFPEAFRQGMVARAGRLRDLRDSAPGRWDVPFGSADVHILLVISAMTDAARGVAEQRVIADLDVPGSPVVIYRQDVALLPDDQGA